MRGTARRMRRIGWIGNFMGGRVMWMRRWDCRLLRGRLRMKSALLFWRLWRKPWVGNRGEVGRGKRRCGVVESGEEPQCRMQVRFKSRHTGNTCEWVFPWWTYIIYSMSTIDVEVIGECQENVMSPTRTWCKAIRIRFRVRNISPHDIYLRLFQRHSSA
jgi:hypothetical protein